MVILPNLFIQKLNLFSIMMPLVSIVCFAYNHEKYISQALDSFVAQKVNFNYEIVVHDDASTDKTALIIRDFQEKHPHLFRPIFQDINQHSIEKGRVSRIGFNAARGKYIALCEGDDYWTDPNKLQKQVDFLESNTSNSACAHQSTVIYEDSTRKSHEFNNIRTNCNFYKHDLLGLRKFHTASFVFRSDILRNISKFPSNITSGDRALYLLCSLYGPIGYLHDSMCIYRKSNIGLSYRINVSHLKQDFNIIPWIKKIDRSFPANRYRAYVHKTIIEYPDRMSLIPLLKHFFLHIWYSFSYFPENRHEMKASFRIFFKQLKKNFKNG